MKVYERIYDNPLREDGTRKPNTYLGNYKIIQTLWVDSYSSQRIGKKDGEIYLIEEIEVSGHNGGSRFAVTKLNL